jgi:hypothetical protein
MRYPLTDRERSAIKLMLPTATGRQSKPQEIFQSDGE